VITHQAIRQKIHDLMVTVPNVGTVHTFERYAAIASKLKQLYLSNGKICGWYIRLVRTQRDSPSLGRYAVLHTWGIRGFMAFDDAAQSELAFDDLVEALQELFQAHETLDGLVGATAFPEQHVAGLQLDDSGPVMFADVLCHSARCTLNTLHHE
jgi:hypothetical protein